MIVKVIRISVRLLLGFVFIVSALLLAWAFESRNMPALQSWHKTQLKSEFRAEDLTEDYQLTDYLAQEQRLFDELNREIYQPQQHTGAMHYSRYSRGGPQDPAWPEQNWNRSFEWIPEDIRGGALLLHGLTDSPYSMRKLAEILYAQGFYVLVLRMPGHGTIPAALTKVTWQDWQAASHLGARHVRQRIGPDLPFFMGGYSNGGGLAVKYALDALFDESMPMPEQLLLFSPEIGIAAVARFANWYKLWGWIPYFAQSRWLGIQPEFDPFKYNSFPKNAAQQAWAVTAALRVGMRRAQNTGKLANFPGILTFLSWTDATVHTSATIQRLYGRLDNLDSELVIFDVNRNAELTPFIPAANASPLLRLKADENLSYQLTVITNTSPGSLQLAQRTKAPFSNHVETTALPVVWPLGVYSLSHVAIPFAPEDPVYGNGLTEQTVYSGLSLGAMQPRGETRLLVAPLSQFMRLRHNPFFDYIETRINAEIDESL